MSEQAVLYDCDDGLATVTFNRPESLNALSPDLLSALNEALDRVVADQARAVLLTGRGRGFCSGADLTAASAEMSGPDRDLGAMLEQRYHPLLFRLRDLPCPLVTAVNGPAAGAGMSLALMGDVVVAARSAYFLQAFVNIGLVPDAGSTWLLPRLIGQARASQLMMLGVRLEAETAASWWLISRVVADEALVAESRAVAAKLAHGPTRTLVLIRKLIQASPEHGYADQLSLERSAQRDAGRTEDFLEGVGAFLAKRPAQFKGR